MSASRTGPGGTRIETYAAGSAPADAPGRAEHPDRADRPDPADHLAGELARLLVDSVEHGASVGFLAPLALDEARDWWLSALADATAVVVIARTGDEVVGCVRVLPAPQANGRHRADIGKMLVHSGHRRRGIAGALLAAAEDVARGLGRTTLVLDTETGSDAERLYARAGWERVGEIPLFAGAADGTLISTTVFTKRLA
ncbi:GNAT family N-acetyltransferase [Pedococcus aerophilus]|uniref:GNAT family N-acetyltransferase n=1 Tax=Pedococcus aerophilus TaxID=436356 RepID=A0ABP6HDN1_9MICO